MRVKIKKSYFNEFEAMVQDMYMWDEETYEVDFEEESEIGVIVEFDVKLDDNDEPIEEARIETFTIPKKWIVIV